MKKFIRTILILTLALCTVLSMNACTYRADGSVCQDIEFTFNYTNDKDESISITSTLTVYKTFAKENAKRIIELAKDGYYVDTAVVFDRYGSYLEIGTYTEADGEYTVKQSDYSCVKGEFVKNGQSSRLSIENGSVIMLRAEDEVCDSIDRYNTAKVSFVIVINNDNHYTKNDYTVVGKIDADSLLELQKLYAGIEEDEDTDDEEYVECLGSDADEYTKMLVRTRDENGVITGNAGIYYVKDETVYDSNKVELEKDTNDEFIDTTYSDAKYSNVVILPREVVKITSTKVK